MVEMIIVLVVIIGLAGVTQWYKGSVNEATPSLLCKTSVVLRSNYLEPTGAGSSLFKKGFNPPVLNCPYNKLTLNGENLELKIKIAEELRNCWDKMNGNKNQLARMVRSGEIYCLDCSRITLGSDVPVGEMKQYLAKTKLLGNDKITYSDYLDTSFGKLSVINMFLNPVLNDIPLPGQDAPVRPLSVIQKGVPHEIVFLSRIVDDKPQSHLVFVPTETVPNLACQEYYQLSTEPK